MTRVAVIGAGIVGASVAYRLAQGGATVTLIDRATPGQGTTSRSFAWLNANRKTPRAYFDLNVAGMAEHRVLADELEPGDWLHPSGNLIWVADTDRGKLEERVARLSTWGYAAELTDASTVRAELEPHLAIPEAAPPIGFFREESWVEAPRLAGCMLEAAARHGLKVRPETEVTAIERDGGEVVGVTLGGGEQVTVDAVVNAAGVGAAEISRLAGVPLPMAPTAGLLVRLEVDGDPIGRLIHTPGVNLRPDGPGRVLLHHDSVDEKLGERRDIAADDPMVHDLIEAAVTVVPMLRGAPVHDARIGVRPITADGHPSVGSVPGLGGYYEAVTHSGVTLGPLLGRLVAAEVLHGTVDPMLATFRPDRSSGDDLLLGSSVSLRSSQEWNEREIGGDQRDPLAAADRVTRKHGEEGEEGGRHRRQRGQDRERGVVDGGRSGQPDDTTDDQRVE